MTFLDLLDANAIVYRDRADLYTELRANEPVVGEVLALNGSRVVVATLSGTLAVDKKGGSVGIGETLPVDVDRLTVQGAAGLVS